MAPSFDHLVEENLDDEEFDEDEVDISDLKQKYEVQLESGLDTFVVVDGLPKVNEEQKPKLVKFLLKKLNGVGRTREDQIYMPMGEDGESLRYVTQQSLETKSFNMEMLGSPLLNTRPKLRLPPPSGSLTWSRSTSGIP
jgi:hypothetical protein